MAKHTLQIADDLRLPANLVTESVAILAKRRAGKSTTARRITEQLYRARQQCVVVDPKGDWWGLRYDRTGRHPGLTFIILGGEHGDVPLEPGEASGEIVARLVVEKRVNIILDLSNFRKPEIAPFMTSFMETLYRLKAAEQYRTPVMVVMDEADVIAPQKQSREGQAEMISAADDLVRRGGQRGIGVMMITQRSAVLNKDLLTQIGVLIVLRTVAPQDRKAIALWIDVHGDEAFKTTVMDSLPTLKTGEAWIWAPGWPAGEGLFARHQILLPETFDSSFTPDAVKRTRRLANPAAVDLEALSQRMADTIAHVKENDPRELKAMINSQKATIADLKRKYERSSVVEHKFQIKVKNMPVLTARDRRVLQTMRELQARWTKAADRLYDRLKAFGEPQTTKPAPAASALYESTMTRVEGVHAGRNGLEKNTTNLPPGEYAILKAIAQFGSRGASRGTITVLTNFKKTSRDQYISRLRGRGYVEPVEDNMVVTAAGLTALGSFTPFPTGPAAVDFWKTTPTLPEGEQTIFRAVADAYPNTITRERLQEIAQLKRTSTNQYVSRLSRRLLVRVDSHGVRLSPDFFTA